MMTYARNRLTFIGRVGSPPSLHTVSTDFRVCTFWLVTHDIVPSEPGSPPVVQWHRIVAWQLTADTCAERCMIGEDISIMGRLVNRRWYDAHGTAHDVTEIVAEDIIFLCGGRHWLVTDEWIVPDNIRAEEPYQPPQEPDVVSRHFWSSEVD